MSWVKRAGRLLFVLATVIAGIGVGYYHFAINQSLEISDDVFVVERGDTLSAVLDKMLGIGMIDEPHTLKIHASLNDLTTEIKAGEYVFPDGITPAELLQRLVLGQGQQGNRITIIEGWTFKQMRETIGRVPKLIHTTRGWTDQKIMAALGAPDLHPEGRFYPDTYYYRRDDPDIKIFKAAFDHMEDRLDQAWSQRKEKLEIKNRDEALILASIIEKETQAEEEQEEISGVFNNRLRIGMRLQTDPTVIYGIGDAYKGNITKKHLKTDTPYNTYTRYGLPPTPICLPGYSSLHAAVNPRETEALYMVAMGGGRHKFSKTLEEHNAAVRKYILKKSN